MPFFHLFLYLCGRTATLFGHFFARDVISDTDGAVCSFGRDAGGARGTGGTGGTEAEAAHRHIELRRLSTVRREGDGRRVRFRKEELALFPFLVVTLTMTLALRYRVLIK